MEVTLNTDAEMIYASEMHRILDQARIIYEGQRTIVEGIAETAEQRRVMLEQANAENARLRDLLSLARAEIKGLQEAAREAQTLLTNYIASGRVPRNGDASVVRQMLDDVLPLT